MNICSVAAPDDAVEAQVSREPLAQGAAPAHSGWRKGDIVLLTLLTLLSLFLRIAWAVTRDVVIENEGAEYTRIAVNLAAGSGYVGTMGGPQLVDHPLYPIPIRTGLFFIHSPVASARAVSIAAGTLLVPLVFLIVSAGYGRRPAWIAAVLSGLHPFLIGFSASTYADPLYTTLLAGVIYFTISSLREPRISRFIALGSLLGLAYLTKAEMIAEMAALPVLIAAIGAWKHGLKYAVSGATIVLACSAVFAGPYIVYLSRHAHHLRLEGTSELTFLVIARVNAGMDPYRAAFGLSDTGQQEGPLLSSQYVFGGSAYPRTMTEFARFYLLTVSRNMRAFYKSPALWLPLLILCLFGLFCTAWSQERALVELVLVYIFPLACIPVLIAPYFSMRFLLPLMPFAIIWSAKGIDEFGDWVQQTVDNLLPARRPGVYLRTANILLVSTIILILGGKNARKVDCFKEADARSVYLKEAGLALAKRANGKVIVDTGTVVAFYSGATWMAMPFASVPVVLRYFDRRSPDFIVVNRLNRYEDDLAEALKHDPRARPLSLNPSSPLTIYEWQTASIPRH